MKVLPFPEWVPKVDPGSKVLVTGASGGLGGALINMLLKSEDIMIGAHGRQVESIVPHRRIIVIEKDLAAEGDCEQVVKQFVQEAGGIDMLVNLCGGISYSGHWKKMSSDDWDQDLALNLSIAFYLSRSAMSSMESSGRGGRIILTGTESSLHGGSPVSFPYAIAKGGTECMVQGLAREGAPNRILVNGVRFGFIESGFHQRWHNRDVTEMEERAQLVPIKRGGHPDEAAALMIYLLSGWAEFITGQMIPLTGGDWL
ncbi:MAG: SDR family oxidoreductase [Pseudomonadota bacterium]|nr:SDR family oxidoreductase [Pseudomonadota bacterium]